MIVCMCVCGVYGMCLRPPSHTPPPALSISLSLSLTPSSLYSHCGLWRVFICLHSFAAQEILLDRSHSTTLLRLKHFTHLAFHPRDRACLAVASGMEGVVLRWTEPARPTLIPAMIVRTQDMNSESAPACTNQ
jgi:hypothetical protein